MAIALTPNRLEKQERAYQMLKQARAWVKNNPRAWRFIKDFAQTDYSKNQQLSVQRYVEVVRSKDFCTNDGSVFRVSNESCAAFARFLISEHPEYAQLLVTKKSILDDLPRAELKP
ncbi:MAG: hypothetical protein IKE43_04915 [Coriobacteriales bacterium]|nr:hypothetical protein [Coriobacteriales bacterium]